MNAKAFGKGYFIQRIWGRLKMGKFIVNVNIVVQTIFLLDNFPSHPFMYIQSP